MLAFSISFPLNLNIKLDIFLNAVNIHSIQQNAIKYQVTRLAINYRISLYLFFSKEHLFCEVTLLLYK